MNQTMLMWQALAIAVSMLCLWQRPKMALMCTAVALVAIVLAPTSAFAASIGAAGAAGVSGHLPSVLSMGLALMGIAVAPTLAPAPAPANLPPDVSSVDVEPARPPAIWASQSFWLAVLAFLAPIISAKLGVQINTPELATELAIVLGFVGKHAWTMHTTNSTQVKVAEARADVLKTHVTAAANSNPAAAAAALAKI